MWPLPQVAQSSEVCHTFIQVRSTVEPERDEQKHSGAMKFAVEMQRMEPLVLPGHLRNQIEGTAFKRGVGFYQQIAQCWGKTFQSRNQRPGHRELLLGDLGSLGCSTVSGTECGSGTSL